MANGTALARFAVQYSDTRLELAPGMTLTEWRELGEVLQRIRKGVDWWLADWFAFGAKFGTAAEQAAPLGLAGKTLQNAASVARAIPPERRREDLDMGHHAAVAALPPVEQDEWLDKAAGSDMSVAELRGRIRASNRPADVPSDTVRLLQRAALAWSQDPDGTGLADFCAMAEDAWHHVNGGGDAGH
jgi:hypothetical protein